MPKGFHLTDGASKNLKQAIRTELDCDRADETKNYINTNWYRNVENITALLKSLPYEAPQKIIVTLTQYGTGGSYCLPNVIIINMNSQRDFFESTIHELLHCIIEKPVIRKYNLGQWQKEGLVDHLCLHELHLKRILPAYSPQKAAAIPPIDFLKKIGWDILTDMSGEAYN